MSAHKLNTQIRKHQDELRLFQITLNKELDSLKMQSDLANDPQLYKTNAAIITQKYNAQFSAIYQIINDLEKAKLQYKNE